MILSHTGSRCCKTTALVSKCSFIVYLRTWSELPRCRPAPPWVQKHCHVRFTDRYREREQKKLNRCWQLRQNVLGLTWRMSKPKGENVANPGRCCSRFCWIKNQLRYRRRRHRRRGRLGEGWEVMEGGQKATGADSIAGSVLSIQCDSTDWHN